MSKLTKADKHLMNTLDAVMQLYLEQMATAQRVMLSVGHECPEWQYRAGEDDVLAGLRCVKCDGEALIKLVHIGDHVRYTSLQLPNEGCSEHPWGPEGEQQGGADRLFELNEAERLEHAERMRLDRENDE